MNIFALCEFAIAHHECLEADDRRKLQKLLDDPYSGAMLSVQDLHDLVILYHEAVGMNKLRTKING